MKKSVIGLVLVSSMVLPSLAQAADYIVDKAGGHAFIQFKIKHLGYSWLLGRFNDFDGTFSYDKDNPEASQIAIVIKTASIDSNHAERDKHLRNEDFLETDKYPEATFNSTRYEVVDDNNGILTGEFSFHGVTKTISFPVEKIGEGPDPWGGYRVGFSGTTSLKLTDYGIDYNLGPASTHVDLELHIEGIRQ